MSISEEMDMCAEERNRNQIIHRQVCPGPDGKKYNFARCPVDVKTMPYGSLEDIQNTDFAISFLQNRSEDLKPFFLGLGFHKPHLPFKYPQEYLSWQLGEHNEWCKFTNFDIATRIPMFVYVPGVTSKPAPPGETFPFYDALANANQRKDKSKCAADTCFSAKAILSSDALVEAVDLSRRFEPIHEIGLQWKPAVFSQYPRPNATVQRNSGGPHLADIRIMGYTMKTADHRYTEWVAYDPTTFTANMSHVYARELYDHRTDPNEDLNVVDQPAYKDVAARLAQELRAGGWGGGVEGVGGGVVKRLVTSARGQGS
nr:hypothetical protein BaRGS_018037 [Batillaria attramentaria]